MIPEDELVKHLLRSEAQAYANICNELDYLIANAPVNRLVYWEMKRNRYMYGRLRDRLLREIPEEERAGVLGQGAE